MGRCNRADGIRTSLEPPGGTLQVGPLGVEDGEGCCCCNILGAGKAIFDTLFHRSILWNVTERNMWLITGLSGLGWNRWSKRLSHRCDGFEAGGSCLSQSRSSQASKAHTHARA